MISKSTIIVIELKNNNGLGNDFVRRRRKGTGCHNQYFLYIICDKVGLT